MGFLDSLWSGIKNVAGNIYSGVKSAVGWVADKVQPIVKAVGDYAGYIPVVGAGISGVANQINKGIDVAKGAVDTIGKWGSMIGSGIDRIVGQGKPVPAFRRPLDR